MRGIFLVTSMLRISLTVRQRLNPGHSAVSTGTKMLTQCGGRGTLEHLVTEHFTLCLPCLCSRSTWVQSFLGHPKTVIYLFIYRGFWEFVHVPSPPSPEVLDPELSVAASIQNNTTYSAAPTNSYHNPLPAFHIQQTDFIAREREYGSWDRNVKSSQGTVHNCFPYL